MFANRITVQAARRYQADLLLEASHERRLLLAERAMSARRKLGGDAPPQLAVGPCQDFAAWLVQRLLVHRQRSPNRNAWAE